MKLKDLVANSLPRVRGRKKKSVTLTTDAAAEVPTSGAACDKGRELQEAVLRDDSREDGVDLQGIAEASWRGNALYRGLDAARAVKLNSRLNSAGYSSSHGMVTSHSAEGFSTHLVMMSRSYNSHMTVSECTDSCPQISATSDASVDLLSSPNQYFHCHYHKHNHHHYHHHHLHPKPMTPLAQNQQKLYPDVIDGCCKLPQDIKNEPGFFRKSFASFRGIKKYTSKATKDSKQNRDDKLVCSVCPYPEPSSQAPDRKPAEKRPAKPKRKSLKVLSKLKENKDTRCSQDKCDKPWFSDHELQKPAGLCLGGSGPNVSTCDTTERSNLREHSVESCSSRLYSSREGSCPREVDFTGFDSASLSGYESDLPRSKVHRSRSRIKTNPWLPSPQPSMAGIARGERGDFRESTEDVAVSEEPNGRFPRSASFEYQRSGLSLFHTLSKTDSERGCRITQRPRSLTPSDTKIIHNVVMNVKSPADVVKPKWWTVHKKEANRGVKNNVTGKSVNLNDLNNQVIKSRPTSTVSPNSEFVMLADNLEQLANNISFEYEEMLDTTLESVSICQEDGEASIQELLTDDENGNCSKAHKSEGDVQSAHSPDSGIGGLGSTDGDEVLNSKAQKQEGGRSVESMHSSNLAADFAGIHTDLSVSENIMKFQENKAVLELPFFSSNKFDYPGKCVSSNYCDFDAHVEMLKSKSLGDKSYIFYNDTSATFSESDVDNTSYKDNTNLRDPQSKTCATKTDDNVRQNNISFSPMNPTGKTTRSPTLMVDERLDIQFHPSHRHIHGSGIIMGTGGVMHDRNLHLGNPPNQRCGKASSSPAALPRRNPRPCAFRTSPFCQGAITRFNDMEKRSSQLFQGVSGSAEFEFPRNITITECVESPTENWQCDEKFSMSPFLETPTENVSIQHTQTSEDCQVITEVGFNDNKDCIINEELVVKLDQCPIHNSKKAITMAHFFDPVFNKAESVSFIVGSDVTDACVQTDFGDDFSRWDHADTLESLGQKALDPTESTRIWLLTGNMQGSADTGYSSLTRDSMIIMDEDSLILAGEVEERAAADRLSYGESSVKDTINQHVTPNTAYFSGEGNLTDKSNVFTKLTRDVQGQKELLKPVDGRTVQILEKEPSYSKTLQNSFCASKETRTPLGTIPHTAVNRIFSGIESQFQEIFEQMYDDRRNSNFDVKRTPSDSSDSTLKSSDSDEFENSTAHQSIARSKDSETGEAKAYVKLDKGEFKHKNYVNIVSADGLSNNGAPHCPELPGQLKNCATKNKLKVKLHHNKTKQEVPSQFCELDGSPKTGKCHSNASGSNEVAKTETADYLEFLRDTPLNRSHLKRPLFLVPGIGPVDMSSSEQINIFANSVSSTSAKIHQPSVSSQCLPVASSMSPSTLHCGKKQKCKKSDYNMFTQNINSNAQNKSIKHSMSPAIYYNYPVIPGRHDLAQTKFLTNEKTNATLMTVSSDTRCGNGKVSHLAQEISFTPKKPQLATPPLRPNLEVSTAQPALPQQKKQKGNITRSLTEKVLSLRKEKEAVFQKIQEARHDDRVRHEQRAHSPAGMSAHRKEALLETLHELKTRLEEQSKLLQESEK